MGRSYHLIATASRENCFRVRWEFYSDLRIETLRISFCASLLKIHKLSRKEDGSLEYSSTQVVQAREGSTVWRVSWNTTGERYLTLNCRLLALSLTPFSMKIRFRIETKGTVLATSAEDGLLCLYRKNFSGEWISVQTLPSYSAPVKAFYKST